MIERSIEGYFPNLVAPINNWLPPERRRRVFIAIAILAFVYANFRAFDDMSAKFEEANRRGGNEGRWAALSPGEAMALRARVRDLAPRQ